MIPTFIMTDSFHGEMHYFQYGNKKFCGKLAPPDFETWGSSLIVEFTSDSINGDTGFMITWKAVGEVFNGSHLVHALQGYP